MLPPKYYDVLTDDLIRLYADLDNAIIADITRRILKTGRMTESAKWQAKQLQESGLLYDDILAEIAKRTDATENHIRTLFEDAGVQSVKFDNQFYKSAGLSGIIRLSPAAMQVLNAGFSKCSGSPKNLTLTTAVTSQQAYI
ncbi:MAG: phage minor capsid protein, partial [Ruminococcus flavefaciens]|nr:phage minor capsid protein [Ruminococcus flavefaciens]